MARARNIKPSLFTNDLLAEIDALGRLLFAGLWCHADREGRLEDRPKRLKAEILPYDECDVDALLQALHERGFILRYEVDGQRFIWVTGFHKHQNPHVNEKPSSIPAPEQHQSSTIIAPEQHSTNRADSLLLIPDSLKKDMSGKPDPAAKPGAGHEGIKAQCVELLAHLNAKAGKKFQPVDANVRLLTARLKEATAEKIRAVIDAKVAEWGNTEMAKYLRPETLFNATKFASYLGEIGTTSPSASQSPWWELSGFRSEAHAINAGCQQWNWREFNAGKRIEGVTA